jgi:uncharacterized protein YoxC
MKKLYWSIIATFLFTVNVNVNVYSDDKISNVDTNDGYTLTVSEGTPGVNPRPSILIRENVTFDFNISITKKEGDKTIFIEDIAPAGTIKKVVYVLQASGARVTKPVDFVQEGNVTDRINYPLQYKKEINSGMLLTGISLLCTPQKGGEYSVKLTVTAETKNGKILKPAPVKLTVFVEDALITGYIKQGQITAKGQSFDINAGKNKNTKKWPIGHIAWEINIGKECITRLNEITEEYTLGKTNEVNTFKANQQAEITRLTNVINSLQAPRNNLRRQLQELQNKLQRLRNQTGRTPQERNTLVQSIEQLNNNINTINTQLNQLNQSIQLNTANKTEAERDLEEADRRYIPEKNNKHKVGFGAAYINEFKEAENNIAKNNSMNNMITVILSNNKTELRKNFDTLKVQGRLCDDNQGQNKDEQTNIAFYQEGKQEKNKLTLEKAAKGLQFICDHWGKKDIYGPAYNCVDMANNGFHAVNITKVPDNHNIDSPYHVELRVVYRDKNGLKQTDGIIHLSLPEKYKIEMGKK